MTPAQVEMDALEQAVLEAVFGADYQNSPTFKMAETFFPGKIQGYIDRFETMIRPFMNEDGSTDGVRLKRAVELKYPNWAYWVPERNFRLTELASMAVNLTGRRI